MSTSTPLDPQPYAATSWRDPAASASPAAHGSAAVGEPLVVARDLSRRWGKGSGAAIGVDRVDLELPAAALVAVVGPSGSGKSTLGSLIAGIDTPTSGSLVVDGIRIDTLRRDALARWRAGNVGIVFQDFHLLPTLTAEENVELAVRFADRRAARSDRRRRAGAALASVGLAEHARRLPAQMSGGEQQRVAIARAIVAGPSLVVADEPTGALDQATGREVFELLVGLRRSGATVVFITHDPHLAERCDRVVEMLDGRVVAVRPGSNSAPDASVRPATAAREGVV